ncbi:MAG TPA: septal ring lytic transglycosylase RlpA family protein [Rhizomicrobium sp.]|nr:septal ring lytic transglycosylase RlpA family protein [Rhizomicrobium sp.]
MRRALRNVLTVAAAPALVVACTTAPPPVTPSVQVPPTAGVYKVGEPYEVDDTWYYPREQPDYDETGVASWYGPNFDGKRTADGEIFSAGALTAAHRTLPMPVNVRVTNLQNGRSLVVRVNDRGPFARGRIIDVSEQAAKLLGFYSTGTAPVRVTFVARADLPNGQPQPDETPPEIANALPARPAGVVQTASLDPVPGAAIDAAPDPAAAPAPRAPVQTASIASDDQVTGRVTIEQVIGTTHLYVQAGAFGTMANAQRLRARLSGAGQLNISSIDRNGQRLYRVRMGPFDDVKAADAALARVAAAGGTDATIVVDK